MEPYIFDNEWVDLALDRYWANMHRSWFDSAGRHNVYFAQDPAAGRIKVGKSETIQTRLSELSRGSPFRLQLVGTMPGGFRQERIVHAKFAEYRTHGEWFDPGPRLVAFIRSLIDEPWH